MFAELLEVAMVLSFGAAWPASIVRSVRSKTAKGKSLLFLVIIDFGYLCGIGSKFATGNITYVVIFYIINFCMVATDIVLYFINTRRDKARAALEAQGEGQASV